MTSVKIKFRKSTIYNSGAVVKVYTQRDGYSLTIGSYLKMSELTKY